MKEKLVGE